MLTTANAAMGLAVDVLIAAGVPPANAEIQANLLVEAELRGHPSHGLLRLPRLVERIANGVADPVTAGRQKWIAGAMLDVDGENGLGPVVAKAALDAISERAKDTGIACATIRANNHLGMLAWYVQYVAERGQVAIALTTSEALVHPWGGRRAMVGSNPVAIGVPAVPTPFVLDMATSAVSMGKIHDHANRGAPLEPGWAVDGGGEPTTDPEAARNGAIAPFGGPKGYGLGIAFEVLVGTLTSSSLGRDVLGTLDSVHASTKGDVFIVVQPPRASVRAATAYLDDVRSSPRARPEQPILVPGDRARQRRDESLRDGLELPDGLWERLRALPGADAAVTSTTRKT